MEVRFYKNFVKKYNSTKRPTGAYTTKQCRMKNDCSVKNPVLLIENVELDVNYAYFNNRYYFVEDIILNNNNIYEVRCTIDILATYRPNIYNYIAFVERSASENDSYLADKDIAPSLKATHYKIAQTDFGSALHITNGAGGCYVVPIMNKNGVEILVTQYLDDLGPLFQAGTYENSSFSALGGGMVASLLNLNTFFGKVIWIPFNPSGVLSYKSAGTTVYVGTLDFNLPHESYWITDLKYTLLNALHTLNKPTLLYNDFRDMDKNFSKYTLYLAGIGEINLNPMIVGNPLIEICANIWFAPSTGDIKYRLFAYDTVNQENSDLGSYYGNLSYTIPWGDSQWGAKENISGIIDMPNHLLSGLGGGMGSTNMGVGLALAQGIMKSQVATQQIFLNDISSHVGSVSGGSGSPIKATSDLFMTISVSQVGSTESPNSVSGKPLFKNKQLGTLSGYIECAKASLDIAGFEDEKIALNNFLNSGFYME